MEPVATVVCECSDLDVRRRLASADRNAYGLVRGWICRDCNEHRADPLRKAKEHEYEVRVRWGETADKLNDALDRVDDYREKMKAAFRSRDNILRQFERISRWHRETGKGCICGKRNCEIANIVDADWINEHIHRMNERDAM